MLLNNEIIDKKDALIGREEKIKISGTHFVNNSNMLGPFDKDLSIAYFAMGCFWGVERLFWEADGVVTTAVGYQGGYTQNPSYYEVCSGKTAHTESVFVLYDSNRISYFDLLTIFWNNHDSTQGMRQGNDRGSQYRSVIFCTTDEQLKLALESRESFQGLFEHKNVTTEISKGDEFFYAEENHQQYLAKNPDGYCSLGGMGFCLPKK